MAVSVIVGPQFDNIIQELARLGDYDKKELMDFIALEALDNDIQQAFEKGKDPETGEQWEVSKRAEKEKGQTLVDSRNLWNSVQSQANPYNMKVDSGIIIIGSTVIYAKTHQEGLVTEEFTIPQRRFLGVAPDFGQRVMNYPEIRRMLRL